MGATAINWEETAHRCVGIVKGCDDGRVHVGAFVCCCINSNNKRSLI